MSSKTKSTDARAPKRLRGRQRVAELLQAATDVFAEKGFEASTMTEIAARAGAPIGSLYQFFPTKEALADSLIDGYIVLIEADLEALESDAAGIDTRGLVERLFGLLRGHPAERAAALPLAEERMDERTRRSKFRNMLRKRIAGVLRTRTPKLSADRARDMAIVVLQLMKSIAALSDEEGLPGRNAALRDFEDLAIAYLDDLRVANS
jgi:AcrR family transcriptional regulator